MDVALTGMRGTDSTIAAFLEAIGFTAHGPLC
jgi:hypothetical protein